MSSRLAAELDHALERNDWSAEDVKWLVGGTILGDILLVRGGTHKIVGIEKGPIDPLAEFFVSRKGLHVGSGFTKWILVPALAMDETAPATVATPFNLSSVLFEDEIRQKLGKKFVFEDARAFCLYLKSGLEQQWGGVIGVFLNDENANMFYVRGLGGKVFMVRLFCWPPGPRGRGWSLDVIELPGPSETLSIGWGRVFPCNS